MTDLTIEMWESCPNKKSSQKLILACPWYHLWARPEDGLVEWNSRELWLAWASHIMLEFIKSSVNGISTPSWIRNRRLGCHSIRSTRYGSFTSWRIHSTGSRIRVSCSTSTLGPWTLTYEHLKVCRVNYVYMYIQWALCKFERAPTFPWVPYARNRSVAFLRSFACLNVTWSFDPSTHLFRIRYNNWSISASESRSFVSTNSAKSKSASQEKGAQGAGSAVRLGLLEGFGVCEVWYE